MAKPRKTDSRAAINVGEQLKDVDAQVQGGVFVFGGPLSVGEFMNKVGRNPAELIKAYFMKGKLLTVNTMLNEEQIGELCLEYGLDFQVENMVTRENVLERMVIDDRPEDMKPRPPVVTVMGHVDHGKTTLLDAIRQTKVAAGEAGGITQHIGAYTVTHKGKPITFLDTPGHEAFTMMRARGANTTDIVVLVVAADDGLMPQTEEAIDHAKQANVQLIVFVNKIDKGEGKVDKLLGDLAGKDVVAEEYQGTVPVIRGSALKGTNIDKLLETIALFAEVNEYKANPNRLANGTVLEARLDKGMGSLATLLVQGGTLKRGDVVAVGTTYGRIRTMLDDAGQPLESAGPGTPAVIAGLAAVPQAGDKFIALHDEKEAKEMAEVRKRAASKNPQTTALADDLRQRIESGEIKKLEVILKADTHGSMEAILGLISKVEVEGTTVHVIRAAVGQVTETDVQLAMSSGALVIAFNLRTTPGLIEEAERNGVVFMHHDVIYKIADDLTALLHSKRDKIYEPKELGTAEVLQVWSHSDVGAICGARVTHGHVRRNARAKVMRGKDEVYDGEISSLKHFKENVKDVASGMECGIVVKGFTGEVHDVIHCYEMVEKVPAN